MQYSRSAQVAIWIYVVVVLVLLYLPIFPPIATSISPTGRQPAITSVTFKWYAQLANNPMLIESIKTSIKVALMVGFITPLLALSAALAVRELKVPRVILLLMLLPLFIPGISLGLANAFFFQQADIAPSFWTILVVHVLWALPFAFLIVLTAISTFDPVYLESAYVHGANRWQAFMTVELPNILPGVLASATFSVILSFNETVRTSLVQGPLNTVQTYIWSRYLQVGLSPSTYALMSLLILITLVLIAGLLIFNLRKGGSERLNA